MKFQKNRSTAFLFIQLFFICLTAKATRFTEIQTATPNVCGSATSYLINVNADTVPAPWLWQYADTITLVNSVST
ncbi:MAG: hypothetical protein ACOVP1_14540, partial [Bacteroidia bacterium]